MNLNGDVKQVTVGTYLAERIAQAGAKHFFTVPGDFTLLLLDELLKHPDLTMVGCCNELNAGYAADGYSRATRGLGVVCVTYCVGGLSVINAVAGAYSDDLPLLVISGAPNTNDAPDRHIIHHTIGEIDIYQPAKCFEPVVAKTYSVRHIKDVAPMFDDAITTCLSLRKPVYLEIACNLVGNTVPAPVPKTFPNHRTFNSDPVALKACADELLRLLEKSTKPVLVGGVKLTTSESQKKFLALANKVGCGVALMPDAKSLFPEYHPQYMGTYWGSVSTAHVAEIVESSDLQIFVGPIFNDYTTTGWSILTPADKLVNLGIHTQNLLGQVYTNVALPDLLSAVTERAPTRENSLKNFLRYYVKPPQPEIRSSDEPLTQVDIKHQIQSIIKPYTHLLVETGDAWFLGQQFHLPVSTFYHMQMQYGSIGWSVGATLGLGLAAKGKSEASVIAIIGDGSFQMTAQELSTMIRYDIDVIIFLINNQGYTIEVQIHDNVYNDIQNWDYAGLVEVFRNQNPRNNCAGYKVSTPNELDAAIKTAQEKKGVNVIECLIGRDDCTNTLLEWGSRVSSSNMRK
eukprot:gene20969-27174_t